MLQVLPSTASRAFRSALALLVAVLILRSPGFVFGILNIDEADYMLFGASLWHGGLPYRDLVEIKPPLGYLTYAPAGLFGGLSIYPMRALSVFWIWATALLLGAAARRFTKDEEVGFAAAWLSLLASLCEVPSFSGEAMMNLPFAGALYYWVRARENEGNAWHDALAGACIGVASLYRQQGAIAGIGLGLALLLRGRVGRVALMAAATLVPWGLAAGSYASIGELPAFLDWTLARNLAYAGKGAAGSALTRFLQSTVVCCGATILAWYFAARESVRARDLTGWGLILWLWLTWLPVAAGGRFYEHYYLQFVAPLAVLAAPGVVRAWRERKRAFIVGAAVLPVMGGLVFSYGRGIAGQYPAQEPKTLAIAAWLREHGKPGDRLFVWGHYTPIYTVSKMLPGTRYPNTSVHMGNFDPLHLPAAFDAAKYRSDADVRATVEDLQNRKPAWVVDTAPADIHGWSRFPLSAYPELRDSILAQYEEVARPGGAAVYRRR